MNNTVLERIGIDPIILFILEFVLIVILFYLLHRSNARFNQLKTYVRHMNKVMRQSGVPVKSMGADSEEDPGDFSQRRAEKVLQ